MFQAELRGLEALDRRLQVAPDKIAVNVGDALIEQVLELRDHIVRDKLSGQLLNERSGALKGSMQAERLASVQDAAQARVFSAGVPYARIQNDGGVTSPHEILPKTAGGVLAFEIGGRKIFARKVNHPGSKITGKHFMEAGLADKIEGIRSNLLAAAKRGFQ